MQYNVVLDQLNHWPMAYVLLWFRQELSSETEEVKRFHINFYKLTGANSNIELNNFK